VPDSVRILYDLAPDTPGSVVMDVGTTDPYHFDFQQHVGVFFEVRLRYFYNLDLLQTCQYSGFHDWVILSSAIAQ
jgi:hypothetical protein